MRSLNLPLKIIQQNLNCAYTLLVEVPLKGISFQSAVPLSCSRSHDFQGHSPKNSYVSRSLLSRVRVFFMPVFYPASQTFPAAFLLTLVYKKWPAMEPKLNDE